MFPYYWNGQVFAEHAADSIFRRDMGLDALPDEVVEALELQGKDLSDPKKRAEIRRKLRLKE